MDGLTAAELHALTLRGFIRALGYDPVTHRLEHPKVSQGVRLVGPDGPIRFIPTRELARLEADGAFQDALREAVKGEAVAEYRRRRWSGAKRLRALIRAAWLMVLGRPLQGAR